MYKGSNREKLMNTNIYDLLCRMQENLARSDLSRCALDRRCILDIITGKEEDCYADNCPECIAEWLNEPHEGGSKNA